MKKTVAILGASRDRAKFGNKAVRAFMDSGYEVYPVHPSEKEIEGQTAYARVEDIPVPQLDMVSVYLAPPLGMKVIASIPAAKTKELWLNPGAESDELIEMAEKRGFKVIAACSIVGIGKSPSQYR